MEQNLFLKQADFVNQLAVTEVLNVNERTARYGLSLSKPEAEELVKTRADVLRKTGRIEFSGGVIRKLIEQFCPSPYLNQSNYASTLMDLVETFYYFKNETLEQISDDDLIDLMKRYFNGTCHGSINLLQSRELSIFARNIRFGNKYNLPTEEDMGKFGGKEVFPDE